ncbi:nuclear transport factor 2 family protein [Sinomonas terrae]|uniref:Nuclear transport factor 2 family protein n=1 Tax=Sinomonas terrae TaxID=2908838 RepID=A0ABS9TWZ0_9MICC|nr:nuclear transport factor 2 family protein [Sinomonas terrae]MCH6468914.1 nuclear transport factor 2 family protein [Sinomonas terrae]
MTAEGIIDTSAALRSYYAVLLGGIKRYGEGGELLPLLAEDFTFDGPLAGQVSGADRFVRGVKGFIEAVREITFIEAVATDDGAALLYDAELPNGTVRFAEFFELQDGIIKTIRIHYNAADYLAAGGH